MPDNKDPSDEKSFEMAVDQASNELVGHSLEISNGDSLVAVGALVTAAARAAAMSGLKMSVYLNLFSSQYETMTELLNKLDREVSNDNASPVPTDAKKGFSN